MAFPQSPIITEYRLYRHEVETLQDENELLCGKIKQLEEKLCALSGSSTPVISNNDVIAHIVEVSQILTSDLKLCIFEYRVLCKFI